MTNEPLGVCDTLRSQHHQSEPSWHRNRCINWRPVEASAPAAPPARKRNILEDFVAWWNQPIFRDGLDERQVAYLAFCLGADWGGAAAPNLIIERQRDWSLGCRNWRPVEASASAAPPKVNELLDFLEAEAEKWAERVQLPAMASRITGNSEAILALLKESWIEGAYHGARHAAAEAELRDFRARRKAWNMQRTARIEALDAQIAAREKELEGRQ